MPDFLKWLRSHWTAKILAAFLGVVFLAGAIYMAAMNLSIAAAFDRHIGRMGAGMQSMMGSMRGMNLYGSFRAAVNESLAVSSIAAVLIAGLAALLISRRITRPIKTLTDASQVIARGDYSQRVPQSSDSPDELGQLANSFNQMAEKLESIESMRRQLIGDISHELRTPLTAIKGSLEGLMDGVLSAEKSTYQQIYREADRLQRLVEDLQELSRVDGGSLPLNLQLVELGELVKAAVTPLENTFTMRGIQLDCRVEARLPKLNLDADRIQQVLHNLLANALHFTSADGHVSLTVKKEGELIMFAIQDDGAGIACEHLAHIFERFYRVDKSRSRTNGGGSGIGLTIAKSLVEAHGGRIWVESAGENQGSTFFFSLPL